MRTNPNLFRCLAVLMAALVLNIAPARAEVSRRVISETYKQVTTATAVLQFYVESADGQRAERDAFGTIVDESGLIITSIEYFPPTMRLADVKDLTVIVGVGEQRQQYPAEIVGRDNDVRVVFVRPKPSNPVKFNFVRFVPAELSVGDDIVVFGVVEKAVGYLRHFNVGRIAAVIDKPTRMYPVTNDARGLLGAPAYDAAGRAVGLFTYYSTTRRGIVQPSLPGQPGREGIIPVQIPVVLPTERFAALIKNPPVAGEAPKRAWFGVASSQPFTSDLAKYYGVPRAGVIVGQVLKMSPAEKAGLQAEDVILKIGNTELKQDEDKVLEFFSQAIIQAEIGKPLDVVIWRPSVKNQLNLTIIPARTPKPAVEAQQYNNRVFGFTVREIVVEDVLNMRLQDDKGVLAHFVQSASWTGQAGLRSRDIIRKVGDTPVKTVDEFQAAFEKTIAAKPKEVFFEVLRNVNETAIIRIEPRWESVEKE